MIIHQYSHAVAESTPAVLVGINHLNAIHKDTAYALRRNGFKFDLFTWFINEDEASPTTEELENHVPAIILARRSFKPLSHNDYVFSIQCFGRVLNAGEIRQIISGENRLNLGTILIRRFVIGIRYIEMMFTRLWFTNTEVTFHQNEYLRECLLCSVRFPTNDQAIEITTKVGIETTNVRLLYRDHHEHADSLADIIRWEAKYGGTIVEMGHVLSWYCANFDLSVIRLCRAAHRHLRNVRFNVIPDELTNSKEIIVHCLRACVITVPELGLYYRVLNILDDFDPVMTNEMNTLDITSGYEQTHRWLTSFLTPSVYQLKSFRARARFWMLDLPF